MARQWNGQKLRELRGTTSQIALADALNVHRSAVIAWEAGEEPRFANAVAIAELFGVPLDSLVTSSIAPDADTASTGRTEKHATVA